MQSIQVIEGTPFPLDPDLRPALLRAVEAATARLRPRFRILTEGLGTATITGVIGTLALGPGQVLDVRPKLRPGDDWIAAVLDLVIGADRLDPAGERAAGVAPPRRNIRDALAELYTSRLERAIRREGPVLTLERRSTMSSALKGRLNVTAWSRKALWEPHVFPVSFNELSADNAFSRGMVMAAQILSIACSSPKTRAKLSGLSATLRPGLPTDVSLPSNIIARNLPSQWAGYAPAWSIARTVLSNRSPLGAIGREEGVSVAIEAWPLMERLLERAMASAVQEANRRGLNWSVAPKAAVSLLEPIPTSTASPHEVVPDGRILAQGRTLATLEAKYKGRTGNDGFPAREDIYQALVAATACGADTAILVYPEVFPSMLWRVLGFGGRPVQMFAIGLGLFSYRQGIGDDERGRMLFDTIHGSTGIQGSDWII